MPTREKLLDKLFAKRMPRDFTVVDLRSLVSKCNCEIYESGRGSGIGIRHMPTGRKTVFDAPHGGKPLIPDHIKKVRQFLLDTGEYSESEEEGKEDESKE